MTYVIYDYWDFFRHLLLNDEIVIRKKHSKTILKYFKNWVDLEMMKGISVILDYVQ